MATKGKVKGTKFENDAVDILNSLINNSVFKRIPGSGALGTTLGEPLLTGDITGKVEGIDNRFKGECKVGYNSSTDKEVKQFTLKKEWLDKVIEEAKQALAIPFLIGKFSGARSGVKVFVVLDVETFSKLINEITRLQRELDK